MHIHVVVQATLIVALAISYVIFTHNISILFKVRWHHKPKRRKRSKSAASTQFSSTSPSLDVTRHPTTNAIPQMEDMVQTCVSRLIPTIGDTSRQYTRAFHETTRNVPTILP